VAESMSESDQAIMVDALRWIERHAGIDVPEYPHIATLAEAVDRLDQRKTASSTLPTGHKHPSVRVRLTGRSSFRAGRRNKAADLRDTRGAERDKIADDGDRVADDRDTRALLQGYRGGTAFVAHRTGATDRNHAANDRKAAAADRLASAEDREAAAADNPQQSTVDD
jgi:hypothetical protein